MMEDNKNKKDVEDVLKKLPPNYPVGAIFLNGLLVPVFSFSNVDGEVAYFINDGQVVVVDTKKVDGLAFGAVEDEEEEEA